MTATDTSPRHFTEPAEVEALLRASFAEAGWSPCPTCGRWRERDRCVPCELGNAPGYGGALGRLQAEVERLRGELLDWQETGEHVTSLRAERDALNARYSEEVELLEERIATLERERDLWRQKAVTWEAQAREAQQEGACG